MTFSRALGGGLHSIELSQEFYFFFDMDGTLCDSEEIYALALQATIYEMTGVVISDADASDYALGRSVNDVMDFVFALFNVDSKKRGQFLSTLIERFIELKTQKSDKFLIAPTVNLFKQLVNDGYPVCIVSGSSREDIASVLALMNVASDIPYFGNEDYLHGKPHPEPYITAAKYFNIPSDQFKNIIVFEDSPVGVKSAHQAGMHVIGLQASSLSSSLYDAGADIVYAKKDIGAEMGSSENVNLFAALTKYLQELSATPEVMALTP